MTTLLRPRYAFLTGGGAIADLIAAFDWSATSLGPIERWGAPLRSTIAFMLRSAVPMVALWGEDGVMIYNEGYSRFAGPRHPMALGSKVRESWPEVAELNDHVIRTVGLGGETIGYVEQELTLLRSGQPEQVWLNLDYSPVLDEEGRPAAVVAIVVDVTAKVLADRWRDNERDRLRRMFEQAPGFMVMLRGPEHVLEFLNPAYLQLVGHRDILGKTIRVALPELAGQGFLELLDSVYADGEAFIGSGVPVRLQPVPGGETTTRMVDFVFQPVRDPHGSVDGIFVQGVDVTEGVLAERAAQASHAQFETFAEAVPNHIWAADAAGALDWFNGQVLAYTGLSHETLAGAGWSAAIHPDDRDGVGRLWSESLAAGTVYETEFRIRRADGVHRWHLVRALPIRDADGRIIRWIGTNTDIHERKLEEAEKARDRDRLWTISQDLMLVADFAGTITAINPTATRLLGWEEEEIVGRNFYDLIHPDDIPSTRIEVAKLSAGATTFAFENRYRTRDGSYRLLDWTAVPDAGRIHAVARDITEERRLARDRERVWNLSPILKLVLREDGTVINANPSWVETLGWKLNETIGLNVAAFMQDEDAQNVADRLTGLARGTERQVREWLFRTRAGELRRIVWTTVAESGLLYSFGRDITAESEAAAALANAEDALRQSQKMEAVGQLTGGIAHDFNNLLQGITGSLEIVQRRIAQGRTGELDRFIAGATTAAARAASLTHRLLAFSRRQPLDPRPVRANPLVASMEDLLRRTLGEQVELELVLAGGLWRTLCDPNQLENAILNLAINARDAMPDGGKLVIETNNAHLDSAYAARQRDVRPGQYVCICVTDTGVGMPADVIARAFEPFFTTKPIGQGTGLGLSMIYGFAHQSEGYAKIYSEIGTGTTFKLYLPRYLGEDEAEDALPELTADHATQAGETVLVVEDEPVVRGLIVEVLSDLGYRALEAADGPAGLAILQSSRPIDLLITDIGLPGLNGRQVADGGRVARPDLKILFMTGYAENAALATGFLEPGMAMITKPFAMEALATRIREMIEG